MNFKSFFILVITTLICASCSKSIHDKLVGEWKGTDNTGTTMSIIFEADGAARLINGNIVIGPENNAKWKINDNVTPFQLDFVSTDLKGNTNTFPMIVRFVTNDKLQLRMNEDLKIRPTEFSNTDQAMQIILVRQK
jgi:hypothetical protein